MKNLHRISTALILLCLVGVNFIPRMTQASEAEGEPEAIAGTELVIWETPAGDGPSIQIPAQGRGMDNQLQSQGLDFDVRWIGPWPGGAQTAYNYALDIWSAHIASSGVTVVISATWTSLGSTGPLGWGGPMLSTCSSGCPYPDTLYPFALLDQIKGAEQWEGYWDIQTTINSDKNFYLGLDGQPGSNQSDLVTVVLHEVGHGLGLLGGMWIDGATCGQPYQLPCYCDELEYGCLRNGLPYIYDRFIEDNAGVSVLNTSKYPDESPALAAALTSEALFFDGTNANAGNGGGRVPIYVPSTWAPGSSYSHLNYTTYYGFENSLMTYMLTQGDSYHAPGPVVMGIFQDEGWVIIPPNVVYIPLIIK